VKSEIRFYTRDMQWIAEVDNYKSLQVKENWTGLGNFELHIPIGSVNAEAIEENNIFMALGNTRLNGIIEYISLEKDEQGKQNYVLKGSTLDGITKRRYTEPPIGKAYDTIKGTADQIMAQLITNHIINPTNKLRKIDNVRLGNVPGIGEVMTWESRYKKLDEELESIAKSANVGWWVEIDVDTRTWVINFKGAEDHSINQSNFPPLIFSQEYENVTDETYTDSILEYKNFGVVLGEGEGAERLTVYVGDDSAQGLERYEIALDARDIQSEDDTTLDAGIDDEELTEEEQAKLIEETKKKLKERGNTKLKDYDRQESFAATLYPHSRYKYGKDYELGYRVTTQNKDWNRQVHPTITSVTHVVEASGYRFEVTFGEEAQTLVEKIKKEIANGNPINNEVISNMELKQGIGSSGAALLEAREAQQSASNAQADANDANTAASTANTTAQSAYNAAATANEVANWAQLLAMSATRNRALFIAEAGQTVFDLPFTYRINRNQIDVYVGYLKRVSGSPANEMPTGFTGDYIETNSSRITFTAPLQAGDIVEVIIPKPEVEQ
jgi:hypothetical protein